ncbi:MAG: endosialidase [Lachnospiraceae bacterium]|nr:endosialidase [Lachnospiraceae bacterium]
MAVVEELIRKEADGTLSFGNYLLGEKKKLSDFEYEGDLYKVKTFYEITKLEKNGLFVYESVPGTSVNCFKADDTSVSFCVEGKGDSSITLELEPDESYKIFVNDNEVGEMKANLGGKITISAEINEGQATKIKVEKI